MPSRALGPASEACVFVFMHQTKAITEQDYRCVVTEFLPSTFNHPIFLFLRPDGTEIDPELRHEHQYVSASQIVKILEKKVWPVTGRGLALKQYARADDALTKAREALAAGELRTAERSLKSLLKLKPACGIKDRAAMMQADIDARTKLPQSFSDLMVALPTPPDGVEGIVRCLVDGDLVAARRRLKKARRTDFAPVLAKVEEEIRSRFAVTEARHQLIIEDMKGHHYLEVTFRSGLPKATIVLEVSAVSATGDVLESRTTLHDVEPSSRHEACATLSSMALKGNLVTAVRARLFVDDLLVGELIEKGGPDPWPAPAKVLTGPDFFQPGKAWHVGDDIEPDDIRVGRVR